MVKTQVNTVTMVTDLLTEIYIQYSFAGTPGDGVSIYSMATYSENEVFRDPSSQMPFGSAELEI